MTLISEDDYFDVLDTINEAALEPGAWVSVLRRLATLTGCVAGGLTVEDAATGRGRPITYFGFDADHVERTWSHFLPMNPLLSVSDVQPGTVVTNDMVIPLDDFVRTEFFNGWCRPQGLCSPFKLVLERNHSTTVPMTLVRPGAAGGPGEPAYELLKRLAPHLMRAWGVSKRLQARGERERGLLEALSGLAFGVIVLDRCDRILFANDAAQRTLAAGDALTSRAGVVGARAPSAWTALRRLLAATRDGEGTTAELALSRACGRPLHLTALPVGRSESVLGEEGRASCVLIIVDPHVGRGLEPNRARSFAQLYGLTPAETRVLEVLLSADTLDEAAQLLGLTRNTAQSHLRSVFAKTGTSRRAELVRLVLEATPPTTRAPTA